MVCVCGCGCTSNVRCYSYNIQELWHQGPTYIDFRPNTPFSLDWVVADGNTLEAEANGTRQTVLCCSGLSILMYRPCQLPGIQIFNYQWGASGWLGGIAYIRLECSDDPPEGNPGQLAYKFSLFVFYRHLAHKFHHSLSAVTLVIYLGVWHKYVQQFKCGIRLTQPWRIVFEITVKADLNNEGKYIDALLILTFLE